MLKMHLTVSAGVEEAVSSCVSLHITRHLQRRSLFHHKKHTNYIQYTPTEVTKKCIMHLLLKIHSTKDTAF